MSKLFQTTALSCLIGLAACQAEIGSNQNSEAVNTSGNWCLSGGPIYTALDSTPKVEAVVVTKGEITYTGNALSDWCPHKGQAVINLAGSALYPGLTDGHGHLIGIGLREMTLNLEGTKSITELQARLRKAAEESDAETLYGRGWIETHWPEKRFPTRQDLDAVVSDRPVILERADGHASVVNSRALELSKIDSKTKAPFGGAINKDDAGRPTGMLIDNAAKLVGDLMPQLTPERRREAFVRGAELYASRGWANIHSMSVDPNDVPLLHDLEESGDVKIRVYNSLDIPTDGAMQTQEFDQTSDKGLILTRAIKLYADGALGSRGAALLAPYSDDPENEGLMTLKEVQVEAFLQTALRNGIQVNTHAIGDKANRYVLQWYKDAFDTVTRSSWKVKEPRWRIEHSQIIHVDDIPLFAEYDIIPSMQPSHAIGDLHFAVERLGKERLAGGYAWRSLIDSGARIVGGSDAPVEVGDPRIEFYAATIRKDLTGYSNENWYPDEKVTPQEALKMLTIWPAFASFMENKTGTIEVGKRADFSAFKTDLMTASGPDILSSETLFTMVDGKMAYRAED
jgi:predicted amidohydrolase YtcJ